MINFQFSCSRGLDSIIIFAPLSISTELQYDFQLDNHLHYQDKHFLKNNLGLLDVRGIVTLLSLSGT